MTPALLAALCVAAAVLTVGPRRRRSAALRPSGALVPLLGAGAGAAALLLEGTAMALALIGLRRRRARTVRRRTAAAEVRDACDVLASELQGGRPPTVALARTARDTPVLAVVSRAADLGADVPEALRRLGEDTGVQGWRRLAAAWQVSASTGCELAEVVSGLAATERSRLRVADAVESELATSRATARLLAVLPLGVLALGSGLGSGAAAPWRFLLQTWPGVVCAGLGSGLALLGLLWLEHIADGAAS